MDLRPLVASRGRSNSCITSAIIINLMHSSHLHIATQTLYWPLHSFMWLVLVIITKMKFSSIQNTNAASNFARPCLSGDVSSNQLGKTFSRRRKTGKFFLFWKRIDNAQREKVGCILHTNRRPLHDSSNFFFQTILKKQPYQSKLLHPVLELKQRRSVNDHCTPQYGKRTPLCKQALRLAGVEW